MPTLVLSSFASFRQKRLSIFWSTLIEIPLIMGIYILSTMFNRFVSKEGNNMRVHLLFIFSLSLLISASPFASQQTLSKNYLDIQAELSTEKGKTIVIANIARQGQPIANGIDILLGGHSMKRTALGYFILDITDNIANGERIQLEFIGQNSEAGDFYFTRELNPSYSDYANSHSTFFAPLLSDEQPQFFSNTKKSKYLKLTKTFYKRIKVPRYGKRLFKIQQYSSEDPIEINHHITIHSPKNPNFKIVRTDLAAAALAIAHTDEINWDNLIDDIEKDKEKYDYEATHNWGLFSWGKIISLNKDIKATKANGTVYLATSNLEPSKGKLELKHIY